MNNQPTTSSEDDNHLSPSQNLFYRNKQPYSNNSLKSTFSETNREPIDYNKLQDRYATQDKIKRPGTVDKLVSKVRSSLLCCPTDSEVTNHRKSINEIEVNINETDSGITGITLSKTNQQDQKKSNNFGCNSQKFVDSIFGLFPIVESLKNYDIKNDFIKDLFAGITIAVLHIPQGMAYGILAGVGAVNGLYVSFFPVLIYGLLGTSKHVSVGTFAVVSIMLYNTANKLGAFNQDSSDLMTTTTEMPTNQSTSSFIQSSFLSNFQSSNNLPWPPTPEEVLTSLCLLIGVIMIVMGVLNLGVLSLILSDQLITSFSSGSAIHVATSQLGYVFGFTAPKHSGHFKLIKIWIDLAKQYNQINYPTLIISASCLFSLILFKEFLDAPLRRKLKINFQLPIDLLVIIIATFIGNNLNWGEQYEVKIMGPIPVGLPAPKLPRTDFLFDIIYDALAITMVIFALLISLAKLYANKFNYKISPNHELIALGSANLFGSFFLCFPSSASLSRSSVQERTGAKTQLVGIISSLIVLSILLYLAPLFFYLPKCVLACIILVALKGLFLQIGELSRTWKISRSEGLVWFVTFFSTVLLDVDLGLVIGIIFSLMMTLLQFTMPSSTLLGQVPFTEIYVDSELYSKAIQLKGIRIFQYSCPLFFLNCDYFKEQLFIKTLHMPFGELLRRSNLNETDESTSLNRQNKLRKSLENNEKSNLTMNGFCDELSSKTNYGYVDDNQQTISSVNQQSIVSSKLSFDSTNQINISDRPKNVLSANQLFDFVYEADHHGDEKTVHTIIIDCSGISTIDSAGVRCLKEILDDFQMVNLYCYLANCPSPLLLMFKKMKFIDKLPNNSAIFATIHDAVLNAYTRTNQLPQFINSNKTAKKPDQQSVIKECSTDLINQVNDLTTRLN